MIQVGLALDRLLDIVANMAKEIRDDGTKAIQRTSLLLVGGSFFIALLNLFLTRRVERHPVRLTAWTSLKSIPATPPSHFLWPVTPRARHCVRNSSLLGHPTRLSP